MDKKSIPGFENPGSENPICLSIPKTQSPKAAFFFIHLWSIQVLKKKNKIKMGDIVRLKKIRESVEK